MAFMRNKHGNSKEMRSSYGLPPSGPIRSDAPEVKFEDERDAVDTRAGQVDLVIESSGVQASSLMEEELFGRYDRQLPRFPGECLNNVKSLLTTGSDVVTSTTVMQRHLMPPPGKPNKYTCTAARYFLTNLEGLGLGKIEKAGRKAIQFPKRPWEELDDEALDLMGRCNVSSACYKKLKS
ncbi:uncharacterized protein LOC5510512 isoform X1 [Nematostella vectensis]|uniref:uncharacterized protein LOC5510512 isoform X1 n=1 Tax=Nematostella vectensis TaxID=45351 RepID=UPI00207717DC|nr:uncharacterized protein LOC5510512 isoform X1 [Nematostella vectensis]